MSGRKELPAGSANETGERGRHTDRADVLADIGGSASLPQEPRRGLLSGSATGLKRRELGRPLTILAVIVAFAVMLWFNLSKWEGCFLAVVLALPTVWLTDYRGRVVRVKSYDADKVTFEFKRSEYGQQFGNLHKVASGVAAN